MSSLRLKAPAADTNGVREVSARGTGWSGVAMIISQIAQAASAFAVAAAVGPSEFAIWGIASVLYNAQYLVGSLGLGQALIYRRAEHGFAVAVDTAFVTVTGVAVFLGAAAFAAAPATAAVWKDIAPDDVVRVVRLMSVVFVFATIAQLPQALIEKTLDFRRRALAESAVSVVYVGCAFGLLAAGYGVWSLVIARLVQSALLLGVLWTVSPVTPRMPPRPDTGVLRALLHYGKFITLSAILGVVFSNADTIVVGAIAGAEALGSYALAYSVATLAPTFLALTVGRVFFPLLAAVRHKMDAAQDAFATALHFLAIVIMPASGALLTVVPGVMPALFGGEWIIAGALLPVLSLYGMARVAALAGNVTLSATGRPDLVMWVEVIDVACATIGVLLLSQYGVRGIAWGFTLAQWAGALFALWNVRRFLRRSALAAVLAPVAATGVAIGAVLTSSAVATLPPQALAWLTLAVFSSVYVVALLTIDRQAWALVGLVVRRHSPVPTGR